MDKEFVRTQWLLGRESMDRLARARVAVFGIGGVGGYVVEALARSGVGSFVLVDHDRVSPSNVNRQIIAGRKTIGQYKADVMKERVLDINPDAAVEVRKCFFLPENAEEFDFSQYSYVVDAVDTVTAKIEIILRAKQSRTPVISSMGTGNKLDAAQLEIADIFQTSVCPLARVMRRELKKRGIRELKVVYSREKPIRPLREEAVSPAEKAVFPAEEPIPPLEEAVSPAEEMVLLTREGILPSEDTGCHKQAPGSVSFVPSVAGLLLAGEVVREIAGR